MRSRLVHPNVEQKLRETLKRTKYEPEENLSLNVWHTIVLRDKRTSFLKLWAFSLAGLASLSGLIPAYRTLASDLTQSGFYEYFSIIFSNSELLASYWKEIALSILESLPIMSIVLSLALVFLFFLSLKYIAKQIINSQLSLSLSI